MRFLPVNPSNCMLRKSIILSQALLTWCNYSSWWFRNVFWQIIYKWKGQDNVLFSQLVLLLFFPQLSSILCVLDNIFHNGKKEKDIRFLECSHIGSRDMSGLRMLWHYLISCRIEDLLIILSNGIHFCRGLSSLSSASRNKQAVNKGNVRMDNGKTNSMLTAYLKSSVLAAV